MSTVFPVEVQMHDAAGEKSSKTLLQGFTRDVGEGGMCLELKSFGKKTEELITLQNAKLSLYINPNFSKKPIHAFGRIAWTQKEDQGHAVLYRIGVAYIQIEEKSRKRIIRYARNLIWMPRIAALGVLMLAGALIVYAWNNYYLVDQNQKLVNQVVEQAEKRSAVYAEIMDLQEKRREFETQLSATEQKMKELQDSISQLAVDNSQQKESYEAEIQKNKQTQNNLQLEIQKITEERKKIGTVDAAFQTNFPKLEKTTLKRMAEWVKTHQNLKTGLVTSFEGDSGLEDWGFTYDQSLACQVFLLFQDFHAAETILNFYNTRAEKESGAFFNAYHTVDGSPMEHQIKVGPNVWLGIAALKYEQRVKDGQFTKLATDIADWLVGMQDSEGGFRGGPEDKWYSTEHNLDAYAFLKMYEEITGDTKYTAIKEKNLSWIKKYAYTNKEKRMNRGKGDATISTDTFSWAVAAIGPNVLKELGMDAEAIMEFAEKNCKVSVEIIKPNGQKIKVKGFDFSKVGNLGRGGVISTEWTAQMVVAYQILSDYYSVLGDKDRSLRYYDKAVYYLNELQKLIITSPSRTGQGRGCLPYASTDNVDTGHGWRTPKGSQTGSVSGTAYCLFAWTKYNPLSSKEMS